MDQSEKIAQKFKSHMDNLTADEILNYDEEHHVTNFIFQQLAITQTMISVLCERIDNLTKLNESK